MIILYAHAAFREKLTLPHACPLNHYIQNTCVSKASSYSGGAYHKKFMAVRALRTRALIILIHVYKANVFMKCAANRSMDKNCACVIHE